MQNLQNSLEAKNQNKISNCENNNAELIFFVENINGITMQINQN